MSVYVTDVMSANIAVDIRRECQLRFDDYLLSKFGRWTPEKAKSLSITADDIYEDLHAVRIGIIQRNVDARCK